jgi:hypothetical protein
MGDVINKVEYCEKWLYRIGSKPVTGADKGKGRDIVVLYMHLLDTELVKDLVGTFLSEILRADLIQKHDSAYRQKPFEIRHFAEVA